MVVYTPHTLIEFGGSIVSANGNDIWACGLRVVDNNALGPLPDPATYMESIASGLSSWFSASTHHIGPAATLLYLKVNNIGADGKYADKANTNRHDFASVAGGASSTGTPAFIGLVGTWETANARGLAHRGRMYLPNYALSCSGNEVSTTLRDSVRSDYVSLYAVLCTHFDTGANEAIGIVASGKNGAFNQITGVSVDTVVDVQRRRKNATAGARSTVATVAPS